MGWHSVVHDLARDLALRNHTPPRFAIAPLARSLLSREETRREAIWRWTQAGTPCQTLCHANPALSHRTVFWEIRKGWICMAESLDRKSTRLNSSHRCIS